VVVTRRNGNGKRDQDLALALLRLEAAFGPVQVLAVRPNPRPAGQPRPDQDTQAGQETAQAALDLGCVSKVGVCREMLLVWDEGT
jgi:hypothetical protein